MKPIWIVVGAVLLAALAGVGAWYYLRQADKGMTVNTSQSRTDTSSRPAAGNSSQPSGQSDKQTYRVSVYFSKHPDSDNDPGAVFPVSRISPDLGVAAFSVQELLKGPTADETQQGYFTAAQLREGTGSGDFNVTIKDGTATLRFLKQFDHRGVVADGQAESELKATLMQFEGVRKVVILNASGNCEFDLSGLNKCL